MNKILITGGAGYIGRAIVNSLHKNNNLYVLDNLSTGNKSLLKKKCKFIKKDLNNLDFLKKFLDKERFDIIIHLAASTNVAESERNKKKYFKNNIVNTLNLLKCLKNVKLKSLIFSSSAGVYGKSPPPIDERSLIKPINYYSYTKKICEKNIINYSKKYDFNYFILRYFNVCGSSKKDEIGQLNKSNDSLISNLSLQSLKKKPFIKIYGVDYDTKDGTCVRDYIHVLDIASIHSKLIKYIKNKNKSLIINCGYGKGYTVMEVIKNYEKIIKKKIIIKNVKRRMGDIPISFAKTSLLKKLLKWRPRFNNLTLIIKSSLEWQKKIKFYKPYTK